MVTEVNNGESGDQQINRSRFRLNLSADKPLLTYIIVVINIFVAGIIYFISARSGTSYSQLLLDFGAKDNVKIILGEYWRFITPIFLHANILHLAINCYSIFLIGSSVEKIFGRFRFLAVYLAAGILGNIASFVFSASWSVGASGSIFGLLGTLLYFGLENPKLFKAFFGTNILVTIILNLFYGFTNTGIDNSAHIGGLIGGFLTSGVLSKVKSAKLYMNRYLYLALTVIIIFTGMYFGFNNSRNNVLLKVNELQQYDTQENWDMVIQKGNEILNLNPNKESEILTLWTLARAEGITNLYYDAIQHAKLLITLDAKNGHYLLGLLYYEMGNFEDSKTELQTAKDLKASYSQIDTLLTEIEKKGK